MDIDLLPFEIEILKNHSIIPAIKSVRDRTGMDLSTARQAVEQAAMRLGIMEDGVCHTCGGTGQERRWKR